MFSNLLFELVLEFCCCAPVLRVDSCSGFDQRRDASGAWVAFESPCTSVLATGASTCCCDWADACIASPSRQSPKMIKLAFNGPCLNHATDVCTPQPEPPKPPTDRLGT